MADRVVRKLSPQECRWLLARGGLGRVAVSVAALPAIVPTYFALVDDAVVLRASEGSTLARAMLGNVVAFEVDGTDEANRCDWSVLVVGLAASAENERIHDEVVRRLEAWPLHEPVIHFRIPTAHISGRVIAPVGASIGADLIAAIDRGAEAAVRY